MFRQYRLFGRFIRYYKLFLPNRLTRNFPKFNRLCQVQLLIGSQIFCAPIMDEEQSTENLEDEIQKAINEGQNATVKLLTQLKDFVVVVSSEYRRCIAKQIEIMKKANFTHEGPFSEAYDELPEYRTLSNELKKELTEYCTLFNTLVSMASTPTAEEQKKEFKDLQAMIEEELEQNYQYEKELLQAVTDNILNEVLFEIPD